MTKLNQIIAVEKDVKSRSYAQITEAHHQLLQKAALLSGISRTYRPKDDEGEQLPPESTKVQLKTEQVIESVTDALTRLFDVTATKDYANTLAKADVKVGGEVLVADAPVPFLLFLEKELKDLRTFVSKLPVLDQAEEWSYDGTADAWATKPVETTRTKKVPRNHVVAEATQQHPAQVQVYQEDVIVGYWRTVKFSGAIDAARQHELIDRVVQLQQAVKFAREEANSKAVEDVRVGATILGYLFG